MQVSMDIQVSIDAILHELCQHVQTHSGAAARVNARELTAKAVVSGQNRLFQIAASKLSKQQTVTTLLVPNPEKLPIDQYARKANAGLLLGRHHHQGPALQIKASGRLQGRLYNYGRAAAASCYATCACRPCIALHCGLW